MAYAFVQQTENSDPSGAGQTTYAAPAFGSATTAGNLIWWVAYYVAGAAVTVTGSDGTNAYTTIAQFYNSTNGDGIAYGYAKNTAGGTFTPQANFSSAVTFPAVYFAEYSGLDTSAPYTTGETSTGQQSAPGTGTDGITTGNTPTLSAQPAAVIGFGFDEQSGRIPTAGTGFTSRTGVWNYGAAPGVGDAGRPEDKRVTATTATKATWTADPAGGSDWTYSVVAVFKEATSAVNKSLAGQTATSTEGTVSRAVTYGLTGQTATFAEGTISASTGGNVNKSLAGQTATFTEGIIPPGVTVGLIEYDVIGQTATFTEGAPLEGVSYALTGQTVTSSEGTVGRNATIALVGQTATFTEGTITANTGNNVNIPLSGQTATFTEGTITASWSGSAALVGQTAVFSEGAINASTGSTASLVGQASSFSEGSIGRYVTISLLGQAASFSEGIIVRSQTGPVTVSVGSLSAIFSMGVITVTGGDGLAMPNLIGLNYYEALLTLQNKGIYIPLSVRAFSPSTIKIAWQRSNSSPGLVVSQSPAAGFAAKPNQAVTLTISQFPFGSVIDSPPDWSQVN